jgi:hypothetical protein
MSGLSVSLMMHLLVTGYQTALAASTAAQTVQGGGPTIASMGMRLRQWWPVVKLALGLLILFLIGRQFWRDLQRLDLRSYTLHPGWLAASGALYLLGLAFSALTWRRLLTHFGQRPPLLTTLRAYYIGHLGKYLPGKAWALFLRASLARGNGVGLGLATVTSFYEVLVTMTGGVLVAAVLFLLLAPDTTTRLDLDNLRRIVRLEEPEGELGRRPLVGMALGLLLPLGTIIAPPVFNRLMHRMSLPFRDKIMGPLPRFRWAYLAEGLLLTGTGWVVLGGSLVAALHAVLGSGPAWSPAMLGRMPAIMGLAYVFGFVILFAPSGLGVREFFLVLFLTPDLVVLLSSDGSAVARETAQGVAVLVVVLLRLVWTAAEMVAAGVLWPMRTESPEPVPV